MHIAQARMRSKFQQTQLHTVRHTILNSSPLMLLSVVRDETISSNKYVRPTHRSLSDPRARRGTAA